MFGRFRNVISRGIESVKRNAGKVAVALAIGAASLPSLSYAVGDTAFVMPDDLLAGNLALSTTTAGKPYFLTAILVGIAFVGVGLIIGTVFRRGPRASKGRS